jgi:hypothetical protein
MGLFDKKAAFGPAMLALVGASAVTPEMATAANTELEAMGISGAALITEAAHQALEAGSTAWDAALEALTTAGATDVAALASERDVLKTGMASVNSALTAAGAADVAALAADRDKHKALAESYGELPGQLASNAHKTGTDVAEEGADEAASAIGNLAHNKALEGHPVFG